MREGRGWFDGAARTGGRAGERALVRGVLAVEVARGSGGSCARELGIEEMGSGERTLAARGNMRWRRGSGQGCALGFGGGREMGLGPR